MNCVANKLTILQDISKIKLILEYSLQFCRNDLPTVVQVFLTGDPVAAGPGSEVLTVRATQVSTVQRQGHC